MTNNFQRWKGIMKCYPFSEDRLLKWQPPFIIQPKYDGIRCRAIPLESGDYLLLSSEENPIFSVPHINEALNKSSLPRYEYDGELYCHGLSFEQIVSITGRTVNLNPDHQQIQFHIFDIVNKDYQHTRLSDLVGLKHQFVNPLVFSPFWIVDTFDELMRIYDKIISLDYEGIIVRNCNNLYERKRSNTIMKFKPKKEDDYEIVGTVEEIDKDGIPKHSLGAIICNSNDGYTFGVGTGFTASQRMDYWGARESLIGRICRVKYQHLTSGKNVPRFPVFVEVI